jgi:hypothetical protein
VDLLPVSGAAVSTLGDALGSQTVSASDDLAARLDEMQFDLGEGPCWEAVRSRRPALYSDLEQGVVGWADFAASAADAGVRSMFAFPLFVGPHPIGAVDLYSTSLTTLDDAAQERAVALGEVVSDRVLRTLIAPDQESTGIYSRRVIHQATGIVLAQLGVTADDAHLILRGHAFAAGRPMREIADDILSGSLRFAVREGGIEAESR